jgi:hypothetical protein
MIDLSHHLVAYFSFRSFEQVVLSIVSLQSRVREEPGTIPMRRIQEVRSHCG